MWRGGLFGEGQTVSQFVELVSRHTEENQQPGTITVRLTFLGNEAFLMFVHFVYSGQADCGQGSLPELLAIASLFGVSSLVLYCHAQLQACLSPHAALPLLSGLASVSPEAGDRLALASNTRHYVAENMVMLRERLELLTKEGLILLLSSCVLQPSLPETEVWRLCLRSWTEEERGRVREALEGVLQHVRLLHIDSNVFAEEVELTGAVPMEVSLERYRLTGGYTTVPWALSPSGKGRYLASDSSFLFSLANLSGLPPTRFDIKKKLFAVSHQEEEEEEEEL